MHYECSNAGQILVTDLRLRILTDVLVYAVEQLIDLALLVYVHLVCLMLSLFLFLIL